MGELKLRELIKKGESDTIEFKESFDKETIETAVAFANTKGGSILIGMKDKGEIKGVILGKESLSEWANQISQNTEPSIIPDFELKKIDGKEVVLIEIKEFPIKPVAMRGRCYRRVGNSNRVMRTNEIVEMRLQTMRTSWDATVATGKTINDLNIKKIREYIRRANETERRKITTEKPLDVLSKLELTRDGTPTWAAILLFGKNPQGPVSQATLHCGRFKNETYVIDDRMVGGSIIDQIDEGMDFIRKNTNVEFVMTGEPRRKEVWDYPLEALREALINAVCHRDYSSPSNTEIRIYEDKLEIWNPGKLPFGLTIKDLYGNHKSIPRNKEIAGIFYDIGLIERWGSGINKIIETCKSAGSQQPIFEESQLGFSVIFKKVEKKVPEKGTEKVPAKVIVIELGENTEKIRRKYGEKITSTELRIVDLIFKDKFITTGEISNRLTVVFSTVEKNIAKLKKKGLLKRIGPDKGGYWEVSE